MDNSMNKDSAEVKGINAPAEVIDATKLVDKDIFFSAGVAYKKTQVAQKKRIEASMLPIYTKINEAINNGEYGVELWLTKDQKDFLYAKNFRLSSIKSEGNKILYKIVWS